QRRPPYQLVYIERKNWADANYMCFNEPWTGEDAGSFEAPSLKAPLTIFVNQDMDLLATYRDALLAKKLAEVTIQQRINKYTAHIAFHLYQMYQTQQATEANATNSELQFAELCRIEIERVARTLIRLMEVTS